MTYTQKEVEEIRNQYQKLVESLAREFSARLHRYLTDEKIERINEMNEEWNEGNCASHEFMDANVPMDDAFVMIVGRDLEVNNDWDQHLWNQAWVLAKDNKFYHNEMNKV